MKLSCGNNLSHEYKKSDKLYSGYYFHHETIKTELLSSVINKKLTYVFNILNLHKSSSFGKYKSYEDFLEKANPDDISQSDYKKYIKKYKIDIDNDKLSFFIEVFDGKKKMPDFYSVLFFDDSSQM